MVPYPTSLYLTRLPHGSRSEEEARPISSIQSALFCRKGLSMPTLRVPDPKLVFLEAPRQELPIGLLPDAVRPIEAKLRRFEVSGSSPLAKTTNLGPVEPLVLEWVTLPAERIKSRLLSPKVTFSCVSSQMEPRNAIWATFCDGTSIDPCSSGQVPRTSVSQPSRIGNTEK